MFRRSRFDRIANPDTMPLHTECSPEACRGQVSWGSCLRRGCHRWSPQSTHDIVLLHDERRLMLIMRRLFEAAACGGPSIDGARSCGGHRPRPQAHLLDAFTRPGAITYHQCIHNSMYHRGDRPPESILQTWSACVMAVLSPLPVATAPQETNSSPGYILLTWCDHVICTSALFTAAAAA